MPRTTWLTGDELEVEKSRKSKREEMDRRREKDRIAAPQNKKRPTKYSGWSQFKCRDCGAPIWYDTCDGHLLAMDWGTVKPHLHRRG